MATAIRLEDVSKKFILRHARHRSFQDTFVSIFKRNGSKEEFWALKDINLDIQRGQCLGVIGRNGSGKSTLLKLITRILEPTAGAITVDGRISALLELGAGFHPDLTGRENIYLNGSLLGISRKELNRRYDEIVEFSELGQFIDTPVKHYSSGMYMRLGFSIAVSVDPDILITDEILAVGDSAFNRKCLRRMYDFKRQNKTIIMVSHEPQAVRDMCENVLWLEAGAAKKFGRGGLVVDSYINSTDRIEALRNADRTRSRSAGVPNAVVGVSGVGGFESAPGRRWGSFEIEMTAVTFHNEAGGEQVEFQTAEPFAARIHYRANQRIDRPVFGIAIHGVDGTHINGQNTKLAGLDMGIVEGEGFVDFMIPKLNLLSGCYLFSASVYDNAGISPFDHHDRMYLFEVSGKPVPDSVGAVFLPSCWRLNARDGVSDERRP